MQKRIVFIFILMLMITQGLMAQTLSRYEYWWDDDYTSRTVTMSTDEEISLQIDVSSMSKGIHFYNFRLINTDGEYSQPYRYLVYIPSEPSVDSRLASYEFWIDDDKVLSSTEKISGNDADVNISKDISSLSSGIHFCYYRARNATGGIGETYAYMFYVPDVAQTASSIASYEYWLDNDYAHKVSAKANGDETDVALSIDIKGQNPGVHFFYFRALNADGVYGTVNTSLFYIPDEAQPVGSPLIGYRYNFNSKSRYKSFSEREKYNLLDFEIPMPDILDVASVGDNCQYTFSADKVSMSRTTDVTFSIQFVNKAGNWSVPETCSYQEDDQLEKEYNVLEPEKVVQLEKVANGDFHTIKFMAESSEDYYICTNQSCRIDIYKANGSKLVSISPEELKEIYPLSLSAGTYYGIVYNTVTDDDNKASKIKVLLSTTDEGIRDDIENMEDTDIALYEDILYLEKSKAVQGTTTTIPIILKNAAEIVSFSFELLLPEGITVAKNEKGKNIITLASDRKTESHAISSSVLGEGIVSVKCVSADYDPLFGNDGAIVYVTLDIAEGIEPKDYAIALDNIRMISTSDLENTTDISKSTIKILRFIPGDVDMDEELTKSDVEGISRILIGGNTDGLNKKAADANEDKSTTVADVVFVIEKLKK